jgi:hypothetical protein
MLYCFKYLPGIARQVPGEAIKWQAIIEEAIEEAVRRVRIEG